MQIIDAQVHCYERNRPGRPWVAALAGPEEVTGDDMVAAMDANGVDGAIFVSAFTMYRYDASYAREVHAAHPGRFALVKPVDPADPGVAETISDWAATPGAVAIRLILGDTVSQDPGDPIINRILAEAGRHGLPVNVVCFDRTGQVSALAARHPGTTLVIDHLGLKQPYHPPVPDAPFAKLPSVLKLAAHDNIMIKVTGVCTLSHQPYPFPDIWDPLARCFDAFGFDRCLWGTDWTRAVNLLSYREGVDAFRLTDRLTESEKVKLMGGTLSRIYGWAPS